MRNPTPAAIAKGSLVRIGNGRHVYRVAESGSMGRGPVGPQHTFPVLHTLAADADHPDAAKELPTPFRVYRANELTLVDGPAQ